MVDKIEICPKCGKKVTPRMCYCLCDKMWCNGQRCGANEIIDHFECVDCEWKSEQTEESKNYMKRRLK